MPAFLELSKEAFVKGLFLALFVGSLLLAVPASAGDILGFTEEVSPQAETNATEV